MIQEKIIDELYNLLDELDTKNEVIEIDKIRIIFNTLDEILNLFANVEAIKFTTLFAKISWISSKNNFPPKLIYQLQTFRRNIERNEYSIADIQKYIDLGMYLCYQLLSTYLETPSKRKLNQETQDFFSFKPREIINFKAIVEGVAISIDNDKKIIEFIDEALSNETQLIKYDVGDKNEIFTHNIESISKILHYPIHINLIDVDYTKDGFLIPKAFVINPDYLVDVTTVASSAKDNQGEYWLYALNKLIYKENNLKLITGNLAGIMLDELLNNEEIEFNQLLSKFFNEDPLRWSVYDDDAVKDAIEKLKIHFFNIKRAIENEFPTYKIEKEDIYLEPSFYCRDYGIQGRLDLLHSNNKGIVDIVELKSGKIFKPNKYGINQSHYLQTLLYDLIVKSTYLRKSKVTNYIMYSSEAMNTLKYAPVTSAQQYELMKIRNEIMIIDFALGSNPETAGKVLSFLKEKNFKDTKGFVLSDLLLFEKIMSTLDTVEKSYIHHFISFISREQINSKIGEFGANKSNGISGLWLESIEEKTERYAILSYLQIAKNDSSTNNPVITFRFSDASAKLSNFRVGDIAVVYPYLFNSKEVMHHQIFKSTILEINEDKVVVKLRHTQRNQEIFKEHDFWNLEQDVLDSSFRHMYKNLFLFSTADETVRRKILGRERPEITKEDQLLLPNNLTNEQKHIVKKIFFCKDYMLLWGPPGTGKTSEIIKSVSQLLFNNTREKFMLLAYTNKAVDEICQALIDGGLEDQITRIGSAVSIGQNYQSFLIQNKIKDIRDRKSIKKFLEGNRIFVSTLSSLLGKMDLFDLLEFDTVIIDEASQILEPMLCGVLTKFKRFVLIGDHKQLPAVVTQKKSESEIKNKELLDIGIFDTRTSMFERLFFQVKKENWFHAFDILSHQGRMHVEIMNFANENFYEGKLKPIPGIDRLVAPLTRKVNEKIPTILLQKRMIFINTPQDSHLNHKTNIHEAREVCNVISHLVEIYKDNGKPIDNGTFGVITPYRAQITLLNKLVRKDVPIMIDTVERFQGGAKEVIILSLCTNRISQLQTLVSESIEGVDRKLNVAITRTKEQLIIIGNKDILETNKTYAKLIGSCEEWVK